MRGSTLYDFIRVNPRAERGNKIHKYNMKGQYVVMVMDYIPLIYFDRNHTNKTVDRCHRVKRFTIPRISYLQILTAIYN